MNPSLYQLVVSRLLASDLTNDVIGLVDGACHDAVETALEGGTTRPTPTPATDRTEPPGTFLAGLRVAGFRGIGPEVRIDFEPGPGLTLIIGRNGSGKSSIAEGLETLMTGENQRWANRSKVWKDAWRNLHDGNVSVQGRFAVEESDQPVDAIRTWSSELFDDSSLALRSGVKPVDADALGWTDGLDTYRPFLSYNELGSLLDDGPSKLYDSLKAILGLEDLTDATKRLATARLTRERHGKAVKQALAPLLEGLAAMDDDRARRCHQALSGRVWDLETATEMVIGSGETDSALGALHRLAALRGPDIERVEQAMKQLLAAEDARASLDRSASERSHQAAALLREALHFHDRFGDGDCPVCGKSEALQLQWAERSRGTLVALNAASKRTARAEAQMAAAVGAAHQLITRVPAVLREDVGLDTNTVAKLWKRWADAAALKDPAELVERLDACAAPLAAAVTALADAATAELARRDDDWRPLAKKIAAWLEGAEQTQRGAGEVKLLKAAEKWMKGAEQQIRDERFGPIADRAQEVWAQLRQESNVDLARVTLAGSGSRRHVALNVTVDGVDSVALGVMSQGELNALALSLFLPRLTLAESPFRFVVIDDPVQSMDPQRVDGLAKVLQETAKTRQVIVFTHDDRLFDAVQRLRIEARVLEVARRGESVVEVTPALDPVRQYLRDAKRIQKSEPEIGRTLALRLAPPFCRLALEAALTRVVRRDKLVRGAKHHEVEAELRDTHGLTNLAALALAGDTRQSAKVPSMLENRFGGWASRAFKQCNAGAHGNFSGNIGDLVDSTEQLALRLESL